MTFAKLNSIAPFNRWWVFRSRPAMDAEDPGQDDHAERRGLPFMGDSWR